MNKIIDSFIFFNEIDLLLYRLSILNDIVDKFIIVEATYSFSGKKKELFYNNNKELFKNFNDKIIHIIIDDIPFKYPNINYSNNQQWENEYYQRNSISKGINKIINNLQDNDIIITSDLDEIPDPRVLKKIISNQINYDKEGLNKLCLDMYYYNLNLRVGKGQNWNGIKLLNIKTYKSIKLTFQQMRVWEHTHNVNAIPYSGWHLSYFGDINFIINKIKNFSHQEYNNSKYIDKNILEYKIKNNINIIGGLDLQYILISDNKNLPYKYDIFLKKYIS